MKIKKNYLYSIREIVRLGLLKEAKASSLYSIRKAIEGGKLKAFKSFKQDKGKGKWFYSITGEELEKFRKRRIREREASPIPIEQRRYARSIDTRKAVRYLLKKGHKYFFTLYQSPY